MLSISSTLLELIALSMLLPISYFIIRMANTYKKEPAEEELRKLFTLYWDGTPEDKIYAWYKVRYILAQRDKNPKKISLVNKKINETDRDELCGAMKLNSRGELIDERETDSKYS